jgi:hypothetical protein
MLYGDERDNVLPFDSTKALSAVDVFHKDLAMHPQEVVTYTAWSDTDSLKLTLFYIETPYIVTYTMNFTGRRLDFRFSINVSLNVPEYAAVGEQLC